MTGERVTALRHWMRSTHPTKQLAAKAERRPAPPANSMVAWISVRHSAWQRAH